MCVSNLPDRSDRQWCWQRCNRWRITADNRDDLIAIHLKSRMESHDNVVGEDTLRILLRSTSLQWQFNLIAQVAFANDLASTVTIEVSVGDAVKLFVEFHIHLYNREKERNTRISDSFCAKKNLNPLSCCYAHTDSFGAVCSCYMTSGLINHCHSHANGVFFLNFLLLLCL